MTEIELPKGTKEIYRVALVIKDDGIREFVSYGSGGFLETVGIVTDAMMDKNVKGMYYERSK